MGGAGGMTAERSISGDTLSMLLGLNMPVRLVSNSLVLGMGVWRVRAVAPCEADKSSKAFKREVDGRQRHPRTHLFNEIIR